jgi:hypothetical protein
MNEESTSLTMKQVRTMQIIWFAMLAGVSTFAVVAVFLHREAPANLVLSRFLLFFAPASILMSFLVTAIRRVLPELRSEDAEVAYPRLVAFYQTTLIVALALLQGSAFFALVAYQLEGVWWALAIAGIVVFLMLLHFPTLGRVEAWCRTWHETIRMGAL